MFHAVILAQLTYGLETLPLLPQHSKKLNAFQVKGLRSILRIPPSFFSRVSNETVFIRANRFAGKADLDEASWKQLFIGRDLASLKVLPVGEIIQKRRLRLFGHILRRDDADPMRHPTVRAGYSDITGEPYIKQVIPPKRRSGGPRRKWFEVCVKDAAQIQFEVDWDPDDLFLTASILEAAEARRF